MPTTVREAAAYLQVTEMSIYRWVAEGKIRAGHAGRLIRIRKEDLDAFLETSSEREPERT
jgi:excisionase family DNA binding protein